MIVMFRQERAEKGGISMKFSKFSELVNRILSNNHSHRRDMDVTIVVHSPGSIGSTPSVEVQSIHAGFDWDSGESAYFPITATDHANTRTDY